MSIYINFVYINLYIYIFFVSNAVLGQQGMKTLTSKAGKRFWMSEYGSGEYPVTDIKTGLTLSTQAIPYCSEAEQYSSILHVYCMRTQVASAFQWCL